MSRLLPEGEYISLSSGGRTVRLRDLKGLRYLARLLAEPGREFHALDLVTAEHDAVVIGPRGWLGLLEQQIANAARTTENDRGTR